MKHDDTTLQAAIDAALIATEASSQTFTTCPETYPKSWAKEAPARLALAKSFLAKLPEPQPILADDGRSLGQVAKEAFIGAPGLTDDWMNAAAQAVAAVVEARMIRRMEVVPKEEIWKVYKDDPNPFAQEALEAVRARLIAAARGEAEQQTDSTDWKARAEKAEADLAALKSSPIGNLRPLDEAGPVPDGCVRITGHFYADRWYLGWQKEGKDTHFADIRLPVTETPAAPTVNQQPMQQVPMGPEEKLQAIKDILEIK